MSLRKNVDRIKNILKGDYTGKTKIQVGYKKEEVTHEEGDVWESGGKIWTIRNGITQTVGKLDLIRAYNNMPIVCPICNKPMKHHLDKKFWVLKRQCFDCTIKEDTQKVIDGTFHEYEETWVKKNVNGWLLELEEVVKDYIEQVDAKRFITEDGSNESWVGGYNKTQLKGIFDKQITEFKEKLQEDGIIDNHTKSEETTKNSD